MIPKVDTSAVTNMTQMFYSCSSLTSVPLLDTSNVTNMRQAFYDCSALTSLPPLDFSKVVNMNCPFRNCNALHEIPPLDTSKATDMSQLFFYTGIKRALGLDFSSVTNLNQWTQATCLVYALIYNLGKSSLAAYPFTEINWAASGDEGRQALIDTLYTYSHDRAAAGMPAATVTLSASTKALLTDEEIAAVTAKGFTIS